jgi:hypothetical protein
MLQRIPKQKNRFYLSGHEPQRSEISVTHPSVPA